MKIKGGNTLGGLHKNPLTKQPVNPESEKPNYILWGAGVQNEKTAIVVVNQGQARLW